VAPEPEAIDREECSTPFGITEVGASKSRDRVILEAWVLNAFRHHRGGRTLVRRRPGLGDRCSTPFGITEVGAGGFEAIEFASEMCSTPFGITEVGAPRSQPTTIPPLAARLFKGLVATSRMARAIGRVGGAPAS